MTGASSRPGLYNVPRIELHVHFLSAGWMLTPRETLEVVLKMAEPPSTRVPE